MNSIWRGFEINHCLDNHTPRKWQENTALGKLGHTIFMSCTIDITLCIISMSCAVNLVGWLDSSEIIEKNPEDVNQNYGFYMYSMHFSLLFNKKNWIYVNTMGSLSHQACFRNYILCSVSKPGGK